MLPDGDEPPPEFDVMSLEKLLSQYHDEHDKLSLDDARLSREAIFRRYVDCVDHHRELAAKELVKAWRVP